MSKLILSLLLVVASNNAMAEWVKTGDGAVSNDIVTTEFYDPSTIRKADDHIIFWTMLVTVDESLGNSTTTIQREYDCKGNRHRVLRHHSKDPWGETVDNQPTKWMPVDAVHLKRSWKIICG